MNETGSSVFDIRPGTHPNRRPKDAATIIVLSRQAKSISVLMGQRSAGHAFLPGKVVFPGGSTDRADYTRRLPKAFILRSWQN